MILLRYPLALPLLGLIPLIWWAWLRPGRRAVVRFSNVARLKSIRPSWSLRARHILPALRTMVVILLVLSIARPQKADEQTRVQTEGIAIQLVLDRSGSMGEEDFVDESGRPESRLAAVKDVITRFVQGGGGELKGRPDDLIGLISFAHYADTDCPLTRDHQHLIKALDAIELPRSREEDGTAIGDALLLATERIRTAEKRFQKNDDFKIKSRVIVLLTDGEQNRGKYKPEKAAEAAAALGIKVYTIGAVPEFAERQVGGFFTQPQVFRVRQQMNEDPLKKIAEMTGGRYFRASDLASLDAIYGEIDRLERSKVDEERYFLYEELAYKWGRFGPWKLPPMLAGGVIGPLSLPPPMWMALILLAAEIALASTRFRRIP